MVNGSFEQPGIGCASATTSLPGWDVVEGNIDIDTSTPECSGVTAADGNFFIDLLGTGAAGSITQSFATTVGNVYSVDFIFGGNSQWQYLGYGNDGPMKSLAASINDRLIGTYSINTQGLGRYDAGWTSVSFLITATSSSTTLRFDSLNTSGVFGAFLDGVEVHEVQVPEPSTFSLLIMSFALMTFVRRRNAVSARR